MKKIAYLRIDYHLNSRVNMPCHINQRKSNSLHKRFWALTPKGKLRPVAITAIARELVGFIWAMMQPQPAIA